MRSIGAGPTSPLSTTAHTRAFPLSALTAEAVRASAERVVRNPPARRLPTLMMPSDASLSSGVLPCEPVWTTARGRPHGGSTTPVFVGALSGGTSLTAEVVSGGALSRRALCELLARAMCSRCFDPDAAALEASRLLRAASRHADGTVVRLDPDGAIIAVGRAGGAER